MYFRGVPGTEEFYSICKIKSLFFFLSNIVEGPEAILEEQIFKDHGLFPAKAKPGKFEGLST